MGTIASQITSLTIVYSTVYSGADQRKHQSSVSLAFVRGNFLNNTSTLVLVMGWYLVGDKPLPDSILARVADISMA